MVLGTLRNALLVGACMAAAATSAPGWSKKRAPAPPVATISPQEQAVRSIYAASPVDGVASFYAYRRHAPFWLSTAGAANPAVAQFMIILKRAPLDGLATGPTLAAEAETAVAAAQSGDPVKVAQAEVLLSSALVRYAQALRAIPANVEFGMKYLEPQPVRGDSVLFEATRAPSLDQYLKTLSDVNPMYAKLRDAVQAQLAGAAPDRRMLASLERTRILPAKGRFIMVDVATQRLFVIEDGQVRDSMKVVVGMTKDKSGKPTPQLHTPMIVSRIDYATFNPYWHVPPHLVPGIAKNVVGSGVAALKPKRYQVVDAYVEKPNILNPTEVDWKAVVAGTQKIALRQLPGPDNSMGVLKFQFPNSTGIYLHDTPMRQYFKEAQRTLSNGCIRLEDAKRLGRWLLGRDPTPPSAEPEQHVQLPQGVPIYVTYLTAQLQDEQLTMVPDVYGWDSTGVGKAVNLK